MAKTVDDPAMVLLSTKLHAPEPRARVVARPDLIALLSSSPDAALTLVDAPAGWGKTTLLAQWRLMDPLERDFAWLSLDPGDSDPARFWSYVGEALARADPDLDLARFSGSVGVPGVAARDLALPELINRISERPADAVPLVLVLDDYHRVSSREIDADVEYLLDHRPTQLQVAIASRADPALPLARTVPRGHGRGAVAGGRRAGRGGDRRVRGRRGGGDGVRDPHPGARLPRLPRQPGGRARRSRGGRPTGPVRRCSSPRSSGMSSSLTLPQRTRPWPGSPSGAGRRTARASTSPGRSSWPAAPRAAAPSSISTRSSPRSGSISVSPTRAMWWPGSESR